MGLEIREAKIGDLKAIKDLNKKLFDYEYENFDKTLNCNWPFENDKYYEESSKSSDSLVLVALNGDRIVGYLIGSLTETMSYRNFKKIAEIENMFIIESFRKKGIGSSLCERFFVWARKKGIKRVKVVASARNTGAISSYRKCGFEDYDLVLEKDL